MTKEQLLALADAYAYRKALIHGVGAARHSVPLAVMECDEARAALSDALAEVVRDAELWRAYKSRKDAVIAAGMGRNPLRQEIKPDTYAVINADGEVEYSAPWAEACHDHIKDMQDVHGLGVVGKWKVRGITILKGTK